MAERHHLDRSKLREILRASDVSALSPEQIKRLVRAEPGLGEHAPHRQAQRDPRNGDRIFYNPARARRPHENTAPPEGSTDEKNPNREPSFISRGACTGAIDVADLSEGFTFINLNLYPFVYPGEEEHFSPPPTPETAVAALDVDGAHFLQWTSSYQDRDWHNMPVEDGMIVMERLARLEHTLCGPDRDAPRGAFSVIKNYGRLVGGSVAHGHQQMAFTNAQPRRAWELDAYRRENGEPFADHLLRETPEHLILRDYGPALLLVPYFMRRPYDMMLVFKNTGRRYLYELNEEELRAAAAGWRDCICVLRTLMPRIGRMVAYNILTHTGPGAGLHFEILPYTQETGGFEHLGYIVCQGEPKTCAQRIRENLSDT